MKVLEFRLRLSWQALPKGTGGGVGVRIAAVAAGVAEGTGVSSARSSVDGKHRTSPQKPIENKKHKFRRVFISRHKRSGPAILVRWHHFCQCLFDCACDVFRPSKVEVSDVLCVAGLKRDIRCKSARF